ncbi:TPA: helix-turn-helix domain-containing protein [Morganella morganii]
MKNEYTEKSILMNKHLGHEIKKRRRELGYSVSKVALLLNISQQQYSRYERGNSKITAVLLYKISKILSISLCYFFHDCIAYENNMTNRDCNLNCVITCF